MNIFLIKNSDIFSYFCSKHRLWVLVRTASVLTSTHNLCFGAEVRKIMYTAVNYIKEKFKGVKIIQACFRNIRVVSDVALVLSLFVLHLIFFWCLGRAVLRDCGFFPGYPQFCIFHQGLSYEFSKYMYQNVFSGHKGPENTVDSRFIRFRLSRITAYLEVKIWSLFYMKI